MKSDDLIKTFDSGKLKQFEEDVVWNAFRSTIEERIELIRNELEVGAVAVSEQVITLDYEAMKKRQGECEGLRFILRLPQIIKDLWSEEESLKKKKEE